jgi:hypothetical protein
MEVVTRFAAVCAGSLMTPRRAVLPRGAVPLHLTTQTEQPTRIAHLRCDQCCSSAIDSLVQGGTAGGIAAGVPQVTALCGQLCALIAAVYT